MKIEKNKVYIIGSENGWINDNLCETEVLENLKEFETFEEAEKCSNSLNEFNGNYTVPGEIFKVYVNNDFKGYFYDEWSNQEIEEFLVNK